MNRYLGGLMDPFVSLLEVHKLLYFMQEAGVDLRLQFKPALYGPYAENLRHVLTAIEGHLISGYGDGGDAPGKQLELVPGAVTDANAFLQGHPEIRARYGRVAHLVDGFETPFGLELLSTVHWAATRGVATEVDDIVTKVYAWGERKRQFSRGQIELAFDVLKSKGWLSEGANRGRDNNATP